MQNQNNDTALGKVVIQGGKAVSLTPNMDKCILDPNGKGSVEYAKARGSINADFQFVFGFNQALAKRTRKASKTFVVGLLKGKVSKTNETDKEGKEVLKDGKPIMKLLVTFPDNSVARL